MKISIFETEHFEAAFPVIKLFDRPGNQVTVITSRETHKRLTDLLRDATHRYTWTILSTTGKFRFFYSLYQNLKKQKPDILYINTISNNHLLYAMVLWFVRVKRVVMTVHDINCLFESRFSWSVRQAVIHWGKRWLIKQVTEFNVIADTMIPYLKTKTKQQPIHNIPGSVFEYKQTAQTITDSLRMVVPGSLDKRRRDYEQVFELATIITRERLSLTIVLLGGHSDYYGDAVCARAAVFSSEYCKIIAYDTQVVDQDEFDKEMNAAHFAFIPSVIDTNICGAIPETYGVTKSSGNIFDVVKHAKPFIVPAGLNISPQLQTSCFKYNNMNELIAFLKSFTSEPQEYNKWQEQALANSLNYTIDKVRENNITLFERKEHG